MVAPGRADTVVAEFGCFISRVPTLEDEVKLRRLVQIVVALEPPRLDHASVEWGRCLLILAREVILANDLPMSIQDLEGLALRVKNIPNSSYVLYLLSQRSPIGKDLFFFRNCGKTNHRPPLMFENMTDEIVLVKPLHDDNDAAGLLVVEPTQEGVIVPAVDSITSSSECTMFCGYR